MIGKTKTLRILGVSAAYFFSILLVTALLVSLFFSAAVSMTKPEAIVSVVKEPDFADQLLKTVETIEAVEPMPEAAEPVETTTAEEG